LLRRQRDRCAHRAVTAGMLLRSVELSLDEKIPAMASTLSRLTGSHPRLEARAVEPFELLFDSESWSGRQQKATSTHVFPGML
jgi:hypothetical protein